MKRANRSALALLLMTFTLALAACQPVMPEGQNIGMPNPASVFCEEQGGTIDIRTAVDGSQAGYCVFDDGSECDEWAFFRGECAPGGQ